MHFVDGLVLSFLGIMIGLGGFRGHRKKILSIIAVIGAISAVLAFHEAATKWLSGWAPSHWNLRFLSIYLIFIVSYVVSALVARLFLPLVRSNFGLLERPDYSGSYVGPIAPRAAE